MIEVLIDDERYRMPPVPPASSGIGWLRSTVARFSDGPAHRRRRAYAVAMLDRLDPATLARDAAAETGAVLERLAAAGADREPVDLMSTVARPVPVVVLGRALAVRDDDLTGRVAAAARAYQPDHCVPGPATRGHHCIDYGRFTVATGLFLSLLIG